MNELLQTGVLLASAPLLGRLAFAGVFLVLIGWLLWIPIDRLQAGSATNDGTGQPHKAPSTTFIRYSAVVIAAIQVLLYLFWS